MTADEFIANAEALIGEPYSEIDCIGLVRAAAHIRCQGTNWLWRSYNSRGKYQYLTARMERPPLTKSEMRKGLLLFRVNWGKIPEGQYTDKPDCHHVGILTGTHVIQSNSGKGVYRELYDHHKWDACGWLRQISESERDETLPFEPLIPSDVYNDTDSVKPSSTYEPSDHEMLKALYDHFIID